MTNKCECGVPVPSYEGSICAACRKARAVVVATITVEAAKDISRPAESASAYHTIRVLPGVYSVELRVSARGERYLAAVFTGKVTASGYGSKAYKELVGSDDTVVLQPYKYELRAGSFWGRVTVTDDASISLARGV